MTTGACAHTLLKLFHPSHYFEKLFIAFLGILMRTFVEFIIKSSLLMLDHFFPERYVVGLRKVTLVVIYSFTRANSVTYKGPNLFQFIGYGYINIRLKFIKNNEKRKILKLIL